MNKFNFLACTAFFIASSFTTNVIKTVCVKNSLPILTGNGAPFPISLSFTLSSNVKTLSQAPDATKFIEIFTDNGTSIFVADSITVQDFFKEYRNHQNCPLKELLSLAVDSHLNIKEGSQEANKPLSFYVSLNTKNSSNYESLNKYFIAGQQAFEKIIKK